MEAAAARDRRGDSVYAIGTSGPVLWQVFVLSASILSILLVATTLVPGLSVAVEGLLRDLDLVICGIFLIDFVIQVAREPDRWRYLKTWGWLDLLSSVPLMTDPSGLARVARLFRIVRIVRVLKSVRVRFRALAGHPTQTTLFLLGMIIMVVLTFSSTAMLIAEERGGGPIQTGEDALWWCMVTLTTVGYGDAVPATSAGRFIAVVTMIGGIAVFSTFTAFIATTFLSRGPLRGEDLDRMAALVERLERVERRLEERGGGGAGGGDGRGGE